MADKNFFVIETACIIILGSNDKKCSIFPHRMNINLKEIGEVKRVGRGGKKVRTSLFPDITIYHARHTWATIASKLDMPIETISAALGHEIGSDTTQIYIDFDQGKVDAANRKVIDYINDLGKKE